MELNNMVEEEKKASLRVPAPQVEEEPMTHYIESI